MLNYAILTFFISFIINAIIIRLYFKPIGERAGPQQFHKRPTPRFGGVALYIALLGVVPLSYLKKDIFADSLLFLALISFPVFLSGFLEDLTNRLKPKIRLIFMLFSAALAFFILDVKVIRLDISYVDSLMALTYVSFLFTVFALTGITNAVNIIDGFNGLASMVCFCILMAIAYVAYKLGDYYIVTSCVLFAFALLGFFILNYPYGFIFLGDSGAYLSGFIVGILSILLVKRHPQVSAWFALLVNFYPIYETIFSI
ncbi:MraY family glycosyltransferase [Thermodesulfovibrio hydrogeniphilus]